MTANVGRQAADCREVVIMSGIWKFAVGASLVGVCLLGSPLFAREEVSQQSDGEERDESWYHQEPVTFKPDPRAIIFQRASFRADQRQQRLASTNWYGMYNGRPTASATPFTSMYSPAWQSPGSRPFAWSPSTRPTYLIIMR